MQSLANCEIIMDIIEIEKITAANKILELDVFTKDEERYRFVFDSICCIRYSIENASLTRFLEFRNFLPENIVHNCVYIVMESDYIGYFLKHVDDKAQIDGLMHYIIYDNMDTKIDVLTNKRPVLIKI